MLMNQQEQLQFIIANNIRSAARDSNNFEEFIERVCRAGDIPEHESAAIFQTISSKLEQKKQSDACRKA